MEKDICNDVFKKIMFLKSYVTKRMDELDVMQGNNTLHCILINYLYKETKKRTVIQKDIEKEFCVSRSTVNDTIEKMKNEGLISLEVDPLDQRKRHIILTEKGIELHKLSKKNMQKVAKDALSNLNEEEIIQLDNLLKKAMEGVKK